MIDITNDLANDNFLKQKNQRKKLVSISNISI